MDDMRCDELVEMVTDYLEEALGSEEALRVNEHLAVCDGCANYVAQVRSTVKALGNQPKELPNADFEGRLRTIFDAWRASRVRG
jgi:anti-sigma factor RsiW